METVWEVLPWLVAMVILIVCSAFFSASEAALFSLRGADRRSLEQGGPGAVAADRLLRNPDRLLSAVLLWNLVVNIAYFSLAAIVSSRWAQPRSASVLFGVGSLLAIIFCSEMLPKSLAVLRARALAAWVGLPLALAVRIVDPVMPVLQTVNLLSRRLIWPGLKEQPYLEVRDLERAIDVCPDPTTVSREKTVLRNIVQLSNLPVQEWMRPRPRLKLLRPPISAKQLTREHLVGAYALIMSDDGEVAAAIHVDALHDRQLDQLPRFADPVVFVPWCATVADVFQRLHEDHVPVACVVNEQGEAIGVITMDDVLDAVLMEQPTRGERLLDRDAIVPIGANLWHVSGIVNLTRLARLLGVEFPPTRNVTVAGIVQETLDGHPEPGDMCRWGPLAVRMLPHDGDEEDFFEIQLQLDEEGAL